MGVGCQRHALAALFPRKIACADFREGWVGPMAGLDSYEKQKISCLHQCSYAGLSS